jgi:hypothetical protein
MSPIVHLAGRAVTLRSVPSGRIWQRRGAATTISNHRVDRLLARDGEEKVTGSDPGAGRSRGAGSTLDATMTALTYGQAAMDVGDRHVSADVTLNGQLPDVAGLLPVACPGGDVHRTFSQRVHARVPEAFCGRVRFDAIHAESW